MSLPADVKPGEAVRALERAGWSKNRQTGGHAILVKKGQRPIPVPMHSTIKRGLLRGIIKQAGMTVDEFAKLLS